MSSAPVVRAVTVNATAERAFEVFTRRIGDWWPLASYSLAAARALDVRFEDGRLVETAADGTRQLWGSVTEWEPPRRLAFSWAPGGGPESSITVDFEDSGGQTRVVLTHAGWEAFGADAADRRANYDNDHAWTWILELFGLAVGTSAQVADSGFHGYAVSPLRAGYEAVAAVLQKASFRPPPGGEWNARQVAGHVITNAELMSTVVDDVRRGAPARLYGPADHAPDAIGRCDGMSFPDAASGVRRAGAELVARCSALSADELATSVSTYIEHHGQVVVDGDMTVDDLLGAQVNYHLPAHVGQLDDLTR